MVVALGKLLGRKVDSMDALEPSLADSDPRVRANGIQALAQIGHYRVGISRRSLHQ